MNEEEEAEITDENEKEYTGIATEDNLANIGEALCSYW